MIGRRRRSGPKVKAIELGSKSALADGRATLNVAGLPQQDHRSAAGGVHRRRVSGINIQCRQAMTQGPGGRVQARPTADLRLLGQLPDTSDAKFDTLTVRLGVNVADNRAVVHSRRATRST